MDIIEEKLLRYINKEETEVNTALDVVSNYGYSLKKIITITKKSIERFNRLLARTYDKAERDWKKEHMISEFYNFKYKLNENKERITALEKLLNKINFKNL